MSKAAGGLKAKLTSGRAQRLMKRSAMTLAGFLLLFGLLGYFWLPGFAKAKLEAALSGELKRPVSIERIEVSPYTLSATIRGFKAGDVLAVGSLHVNLSSASLFRLLPVVEEVRVESPRLHLVRVSEKQLNISDLLDAWAAKPSSGPTPEFSVANITVSGGQVEWVDQTIGHTQTLSEIKLGVPFIANTPSKVEVFVEPQFSAKLNGAPLDLHGRARPFGAGRDAALDIEMDGFDLAAVADYVKLPVELRSALLDTRLQLQFKRSEGAASSLVLVGDLALRQIKGAWPEKKLAFDLPQLAAHKLEAKVFEQHYALGELVLGGVKDVTKIAQAGKPLLRVGELKVSGVAVDVAKRDATVQSVRLTGPEVNLARQVDGRLNVLALAAAPTSQGVAKPAATEKSEAGWHWSVSGSGIDSGVLRFRDESIPEQMLTASDLALTLGKLDSAEAGGVPLTVKAAVNKGGALAVDGQVTLAGVADLKLNLSRVDLPALQGWATADLNALMTRGDLSFDGSVRTVKGAVELNGDLTLADFNLLDRVNSDDMLRWKQLRLAKLALRSEPFSLSVGEVALRDVFAQLLINSKGQLNLKGILKQQAEQEAAAAPAPASAPIAVAPAKPGKPLPVRIGKITLVNGSVDYDDEFIKPNYSAKLSSLNGSIGALAAGTQSPIEISGKVDRTAPLHIVGKADPFASALALDIQASAKGIELPNLSAYSGRYLGYAIDKGKLSMDVSYRIENGELNAQNKIFLDQLTLGEKIESPSALDIPLRLAIALLKNSRGEIDLDLPIHGSLNDPQFSIGSIVVKVIVNFIVKAVTSPFALLGSLFGGGEDLSNIVYAPGMALLSTEGEKRLQAIAKAMADRPDLKIEVTGYADPTSDRDGLKKVLLERKIKAAKLAEQSRSGKARASLEETEVSAEEYSKYLGKVYRAEDIPGKPRNLIGMQKSLPPAEMEAMLLANLAVTENHLQELAEERGQAAQTWLTGAGGVAAERVFLMNGHIAPDDKKLPPNRVEFSLR